MKPALKTARALSAAICCAGFLAAARPDDSRADGSVRAVCPVVYRLDESPAAHGYHYTFFGNAFFINDEGYLLTVAHVLETFKNGGPPSILVTRTNGPPKLIALTVIATDAPHAQSPCSSKMALPTTSRRMVEAVRILAQNNSCVRARQ